MSETRGTEKKNIGRAYLKEDWGLEGDAHAGHWHRQVSLLSYDKVEEFNARGAGVTDGAFGENLLVAGIDFPNLPVSTVPPRSTRANTPSRGMIQSPIL